MVKQSRKKLRRPKRRSFRKRTRKMIGGAFTQEENQQLLGMGFTQDNIQVLAGTGIGLNIIQISLNQINPATGNTFTPQELIQSLHEANDEINNLNEDEAVPDQENDVPVAPVAPYDDVDVAPGVPDVNHFQEQGPGLNMEDLGPYSPRSVTEMEMGGRKRKTRKGRKGRKHGRKSRKQRGGTVFSDEQLTELGNLGFTDAQKKVLAEVMSEIDANSKMNLIRRNVQQIDPRTEQVITIQQFMDDIADSPDVGGGKRRRKSLKQRGGVCFGNGVGANNYDPNFSIYNTRELTLFPYRPTN
jgi:hypothetical protein